LKAKVLRAFSDVNSGVAYMVGSSVDFSEGRIKALEVLGYVKADDVIEEKPKKRTTKKKVEE